MDENVPSCLQLGYLKPYNVHTCGKCVKLISVAEVGLGS
jgi:hypothetical protein